MEIHFNPAQFSPYSNPSYTPLEQNIAEDMANISTCLTNLKKSHSPPSPADIRNLCTWINKLLNVDYGALQNSQNPADQAMAKKLKPIIGDLQTSLQPGGDSLASAAAKGSAAMGPLIQDMFNQGLDGQLLSDVASFEGQYPYPPTK
jgi:hypothetical protein